MGFGASPPQVGFRAPPGKGATGPRAGGWRPRGTIGAAPGQRCLPPGRGLLTWRGPTAGPEARAASLTVARRLPGLELSYSVRLARLEWLAQRLSPPPASRAQCFAPVGGRGVRARGGRGASAGPRRCGRRGRAPSAGLARHLQAALGRENRREEPRRLGAPARSLEVVPGGGHHPRSRRQGPESPRRRGEGAQAWSPAQALAESVLPHEILTSWEAGPPQPAREGGEVKAGGPGRLRERSVPGESRTPLSHTPKIL